MRRASLCTILFFCLGCLAAVAQKPALVPVCVPAQQDVVAGVRYEQLCRKTPEDQPWSIHVLRVRRSADLTIRAVPGHNEAGEMRRELPTAMAKREITAGHNIVAVVNGDFDFTSPEQMGISTGLSIIDRHIWTSVCSGAPVLAFTSKGDPVIGVPKTSIDLRVGKQRIAISALNKPPDTMKSTFLFTKEFRTSVNADQPLDVAIVESVASPLLLDRSISGRVTEVRTEKELRIPRNGFAIISHDPLSTKPGEQAKFRIEAKVEGKSVRDAIGGFPILVRNGKRAIEGDPGENLRRRHPRTAVCYNRKEVIFTVVDGRQPTLSVGMTLEELADLMVELGCQVAMNTDGGGSSIMAISTSAMQSDEELRVVNSPSDGKERGRGNAWVIEAKH